MEIKNSLNKVESYLNKVEAEAAASQPKKAQDAAPARESGDVITISSSALKSAVMEEAMKAPDVRAEKVAWLKAQVESGNYSVDSRVIADKMLKEESDLL